MRFRAHVFLLTVPALLLSLSFLLRHETRAQIAGYANPAVATCSPAPPGMVSWWDGEGSGRDIRGDNSGTLVGSPTFPSAEVGQAFGLNGTSQYVSVPDAPSLRLTNFTIDAWVNPIDVTTDHAIMIKSALGGSGNDFAYGLRVLAGGQAEGRIAIDGGASANVISTGVLPVNQFTHVAVTYDGTALKLYLNGAPDGTTNTTLAPAQNANPLSIGVWQSVSAGIIQYWNGQIDEAELFSRALDITEIQNIFNAGAAGKCKPRCTTAPSGLVSWWTGDDNPFDRQGTNHGTLVNGATFAPGKVGKAFSFDGVAAMVTVPNNASLGMTAAYTFDAWVNYMPNGTDQVIAVRSNTDFSGHDIEIKLEGSSNNTLSVIHNRTNGGTLSSVNFPAPPQNVLFHLGVVYDGSQVIAYYNGVAQTPGAIAPPLYTNRGWVFGRTDHAAFGGQGKFEGVLDEIELFNRALSASEILAINNAASAGKCKQCLTPPNNMIGWWAGDGNARDVSGDGNDGTLEGGTSFAIGKVGQSFSFNGTDAAVVAAPESATVMNQLPLTVDAWVRPALRTGETIDDFFPNNAVSNDLTGFFGHGFGVNVMPDGSEMTVEYQDGFEVIPGVSFNADQWYHIATVYTVGNVKSYVDGLLVDDFNYEQGALDSTAPVSIGKHNDDDQTYGTRRFFKGLIDEVEVFNRALTQTEIQSIIAAGTSGKCKIGCVPPPPNMVAWWPASGTANDIQGSNQGTLRNGATFASGKVGQAFSFNGVNQSVDTSASPTSDFNFGASDLSIDAWVNFTTSPISPIIFATPQSQPLVQLRIFNNKGEFFIRDDGGNPIDVVGTTNLNDGVWHHLVGVRQGTTGFIYVDGVQQNSVPNPTFGSITSACGFAFIGGNNSGVNCGAPAAENFFNGLIDEVEVFKRALSTAEIQAIFGAGSAGKCKFATSGSTTTTAFAGDSTITFGNGTTPDTNTYQTRDANSVGPMPFGYNSPLHVADITTNATFTGGGRVCFNLQAQEFAAAPFQQLRILHLEGNDLVNRTSFAQGSTRTLCADVSSLSPFVITQNPTAPTAANGSIGGTIADGNGAPIGGVTINLSGTESREAITDSAGKYSFDNVETNGFYTVTPSRANYTFSPANRSFSLLGVRTEASFTANANGDRANAIDTNEFFVRQHYLDFLSREPDPPGFIGWVNTLRNCATGDASCDRVHVSESFYRAQEFQERGYFAYRFYATALGRKPDYAEFAPDLARVSGFLTNDQLEAAKTAFIDDFMMRPAFAAQYNRLSNSAYVDALLNTAGVNLSNRQAMIDSLNRGTATRAQVLRQIAESGEVYQRYYNQAFVVMEYFGYLHRDPDALYLDWVRALDANPADSRRMVDGFVNSAEYRQRFGP
jgi:hypothetical protein